jgi:putative cardiolipin synthase
MKMKPLFLALILSCLCTQSFGENVTPEKDLYPYRMSSLNKNEMQIINNGTAALYARIDMIRRATTSLDLEYFIFNPDSSGRIVVRELKKAADRGVKVRILIDKSLAVFQMDEYYAKVLKDQGIEIRYYNAAGIARISSVQFRNHRKLFVRDGVEAITGGRNIADDYFNLATTFNFLDRDIWVEGELVKAMKDSFELYWKSDIVEIPSGVRTPVQYRSGQAAHKSKDESVYRMALAEHKKKLLAANDFISAHDEDDKHLAFILDYGKKALSSTHKYNCPEAVFATDREGASFVERVNSKNYNQNYRLLRKEIASWMSKVDHEVLLDSPYFLNDKNSDSVVDELLARDKKITIFTNSLASTDAVYVSTVFSDSVKKFTKNENFNAYISRGGFSNESELFSDEVRKSEWGTHSKTIVYNKDSFMIGTFNIDNRSNFYNTEMAIFCSGSPELTNDVLSNIHIRMKNSRHLNKEGKPDDGTDLLEGTSFKKKLIYYMLKVPAKIGQFLL